MQKCVTENNWIDFRNACNKLLSDGWKVIPGTVATSTAIGAPSGSNYNPTRTEQVLVAFFEK